MAAILTGYEKNTVNRNVVTKLEPHSFLKSLRKYDPVYFDSTSGENKTGAHYGPYLHKMLSFMEIPHLFLSVPRGHVLAKYSAFNFDLPIDDTKWKHAVETMDPVGSFVDKEYPEIIVLNREAGESKLQDMWKSYRPNIHIASGINNKHHANEIKYNDKVYVIDSCIIPAFVNTNTCSMGHVIAGVTCNNTHFVYNGWAARSADPAMKNKTILSEVPCALMPADWVKDKAMCINSQNCTMDNVTVKIKDDFCFESFKRSTVIYVRKDIAEKAGYKAPIVVKKNLVQNIKRTPQVPILTSENKKKKLENLKKRILTRK
jgi:hypothetical protein